MGEASRRGTFEERKAQAIARNKLAADNLEALKIEGEIEEFKEREKQIENGTYVKPQRKRANKALIGMMIASTIMISGSGGKH